MFTSRQIFPDTKLASLPNWLTLSYTLFLAGFFCIANAVDLYKFYLVALLLPGILIAGNTLWSLRKSALLYAILLYVGYMFMTSLWSIEFSPTELKRTFWISASIIMFSLITVHIRHHYSNTYDGILKTTCFLTAIAAITSMVAWYSKNPFPWSRMNGISFMDNPNSIAFAYGFFTLLSSHYALKSETLRSRSLFISISIVLMVSVLLTQSRAGALATVAAVALLCIHMLGRKSIILIITIFGALATATYLVAPSDLLSQQIHRGLPERPGIWKTVAEQVSNAPIFGNGLQKELLVDEQGSVSIANYAHNAMLATARDGGFVGLSLHLAILIIALRRAIQVDNSSMSSLYLSALLFGFIVMTFDKDQLIDRPRELWLFFWLPLAILLAEDFDTESDDPGHFNQRGLQ